MISGRQIRGGRKLAGFTAAQLARDAKLDLATVTRAEIFEGLPFISENGGRTGARPQKAET